MENFTNEKIRDFAGTPLYSSPQVLTRESYSTKCDIWSLGTIFYELMYDKVPFEGNSIKNQIQLYKQNNIDWNSNKIKNGTGISELAKDFIEKCLKYEENDRHCWEDVYMHDLF